MEEITIRFKLKHIERLIFIIVIIALAGVILWQKSLISEMSPNKVTAEVVKEQSVDIKLDEVIVDEVVVSEPKQELKPEPEKKEEKTLSFDGKRLFTINNIKTTVKGENWAKLDTFNLKVENGLSDVYVTYYLYIYNEGDKPLDAPDQIVTLRKLRSGEVYNMEQSWGGESFSDINKSKKLKVVFKDAAGNELDTIIDSFKAS